MSSSHLCHIQTLIIPTDTGFSSFDFTNIPQNFTDLLLTYSVRINANDVSSNTQWVLYVNGIFFPSNIMGFVEMIHNNTTSNSSRGNNEFFRVGYVTATPATANVLELEKLDYLIIQKLVDGKRECQTLFQKIILPQQIIVEMDNSLVLLELMTQ